MWAYDYELWLNTNSNNIIIFLLLKVKYSIIRDHIKP